MFKNNKKNDNLLIEVKILKIENFTKLFVLCNIAPIIVV
ncbi:unnamed protein product, partial [marine sediment metagenome]